MEINPYIAMSSSIEEKKATLVPSTVKLLYQHTSKQKRPSQRGPTEYQKEKGEKKSQRDWSTSGKGLKASCGYSSNILQLRRWERTNKVHPRIVRKAGKLVFDLA